MILFNRNVTKCESSIQKSSVNSNCECVCACARARARLCWAGGCGRRVSREGLTEVTFDGQRKVP